MRLISVWSLFMASLSSSLFAAEISIVLAPDAIIHVDEQDITIDERSRSVTIMLNSEDMQLLSNQSNIDQLRRIVEEKWNVQNFTVFCKDYQNETSLIADPATIIISNGGQGYLGGHP